MVRKPYRRHYGAGKDVVDLSVAGAEIAPMVGSLEVAAALLLGSAGTAKLAAPAPAAAMLRRAWSRLFAAESGVLVAGAAELAVALAVLVTANRVSAIALGACYLAFGAITVRLMRGGQRASCGCFGRADSPVGAAHLVLNLACIGIAGAAALRPPGRWGGLFDDGVLRGLVGTGQAALLAYLGFLSITALPALSAARREVVETG